MTQTHISYKTSKALMEHYHQILNAYISGGLPAVEAELFKIMGGKMKRDELEAAYRLYYGFSRRVNDALNPAVKMWQKAHNQPLTCPDQIELIKWLIKEAK